MSRIGVLVFDGMEELDVAGPWEVLALAARLDASAAGVVSIAHEARTVRAFHGLSVVPDHDFASAPDLDVLVVPGGLGTRPLMQHGDTLNWISRAARDARWVVSVCTGALVLASAGLLDGKRATTHWAALDELRRFPAVTVVDDARWVRDGAVVTSAGVSAGIDMALWLVGETRGAEAARQVTRLMQYEPEPPYPST